MASSNHCSFCRKNPGICICSGCRAYFCDDHFKDHRGMLANELDGLTTERDVIQEKISKAISHRQSAGSLLSRIDEWQRTTIEKVKEAAAQAREQAFQIMNLKREEITKQFEIISQELKELSDTKCVLEQDLTRLKQDIDQLNQDLEQLSQPPPAKLNVKQSEQIVWHQMIYVEQQSTDADQQRSQSGQQMQHLELAGMDADLNFRIALIKIQHSLTNEDRQQLNFIFGDDIPRVLRENGSLENSINALQATFDRLKISRTNYEYLVQALQAIQRHDCAQRLIDYARFNQEIIPPLLNWQHQQNQAETTIGSRISKSQVVASEILADLDDEDDDE
ncbi:unnamed protein product [Adineta steineri]|uniref:DED domain-containing protein n=1 Tax=Adineta steineri TaxID=433720 RepID=A0A813P3K2_9BILA|nr:unnamed protein product [Adineta steineri]CAF0757464.1 unnamed protein product [Adineta steineri]CAF0865722.1 unnamed protein product [Adineta steineri]